MYGEANVDGSDKSYTLNEVRSLLQGLTQFQRQKLATLSQTRLAGVKDMDRSDLLQMAIVKVLEGKRKWPRGLDALTFLSQTMRSIASNTRKHESVANRIGIVAQHHCYDDADNFGDEADDYPDETSDPERQLHAKNVLDTILARLSLDHAAMAVAIGRAEKMTEQEVREQFRLDERAFGAARKRLDRTLMKIIGEGVEI